MIANIIEKEKISYQEGVEIFKKMADGEYSEPQIASILTSIKVRGENPEVVKAAIDVFNTYKVKIDIEDDVIDTCGTGGDGKSSINVSSAVSLVLSSLGKKVVKHGNRSQTGKMGSADIFEILGVPISLSPLEAKKYFEKHNFVFLFAPLYHPAFKYVAPVRKQLGFPTIFNYLGPFLNPADPSYQIIGMNTLDKMNIVRDAVLGDKKYKKLIVYSSSDGYDEVSSYDITYGYEIEGDYFRELLIDPSRFFKPFPMPKIETREEGLSLFIKGISGEDESLSSLIALNSALGLYALGDVKDLKEGFEKAITAIKEGKVVKKLEELKE